MLRKLEATADALLAFPDRHPLGWPLLLFVLGAGSVAAAFLVSPGPGEWSYFFGERFGGGCAFVEATGAACPSCGMTRSWTHLVRGDVLAAFRYNAAGALLLIALAWMGVLGALRLVTRDPDFLRAPFSLVSGALFFWLLGPYLALWLARLGGLYPLAFPAP